MSIEMPQSITYQRLKAYWSLQRINQIQFEMCEHFNVQLLMDEEGLVYESAIGTRKYSWARLNSLLETKDFLLPGRQNISLLNLPKSALSPGIQAQIRARVLKTTDSVPAQAT